MIVRAHSARFALPLLGAFSFLLAAGLDPKVARAAPSDGAYGRFERQLQVAFVLGGGLDRQVGAWEGTLIAEVRPRWIDAAGPFFGFEWRPVAGAELSLGVELRPLWPALFFLGLSTGIERLDLMLQSFGLDLGASFAPLAGGLGVGFCWGLSLELPILPPSHTPWGPWLRLGFRQRVAPSTWAMGPSPAQSGFTLFAAFVAKWGADARFAGSEASRYR